MATHITSAKQAVDQYMSGVKNEKARLKSLFETFSDKHAGEHVKSCISDRCQFGNMRGDKHTSSASAITEELKRRM